MGRSLGRARLRRRGVSARGEEFEVGLTSLSQALPRRPERDRGEGKRSSIHESTFMSQQPTTSQFQLLTQRRFAPFFWTQFLGAGNDNIFKFAFTVLATYHAAEWGGLQPALAEGR